MKLYSCKVRLAGNVANEVRKSDATAAEIEVLRQIHGADAVADIKAVGEVKRTSDQERDRLKALYANPAHNMPEQVEKKMRMFRDLFGHDRLPLPEDLGEDVPEAPVVAAKRVPAFAE